MQNPLASRRNISLAERASFFRVGRSGAPGLCWTKSRVREESVKTSRERILTTHVGSLPRPDELIQLNRARQAGEAHDERLYESRLAAAVTEVAQRQQAAGIDIANDGEYGKAMGSRINYGAWWSYSFQRLGGLTLGTEIFRLPPRRSAPGEVRLTSFSDRRDRALFAAAYADPDAGVSTMPRGGAGMKLPGRRQSPPTSPISRRRSPPPASRKAS
jgi:5-methyltetrahydropteroyltriglutamate--homocysteine methyltransferase